MNKLYSQNLSIEPNFKLENNKIKTPVWVKFKNMKERTILIIEILVYISIIAIAFYLIAKL